MKTNKTLTVLFHGCTVGTLAVNGQGKVAFSYDEDWLETGFSISPFSLPLKKQVFVPDKMHFQGLFGVFADSLPDAWGHRKQAATGICWHRSVIKFCRQNIRPSWIYYTRWVEPVEVRVRKL